MYEWFQGYCGWFGRGAGAAGGGPNGRMRGRTDARVRGRTNENTGLHPVLGYFAPSGLDGFMLMRIT